MGLFDVIKAERYFWEVVGKTKENTLLKRWDKVVEEQNLSGDDLVKKLTDKFKDIKIQLNEKKVEKLLNKGGVVDLLSSWPQTSADNSNFKKLVNAKVVNNPTLKNYLIGKNVPPKIIQNIKESLVRYLKLTNNMENDTVPGYETIEINKLTRNKNKDTTQKMQSRRKSNRLKVMTPALIIHLIDVVTQSNDSKEISNNTTEQKQKEAKKSQGIQDDLITRLSNGEATKEEFESLDKETYQTLIKIVVPKGAKVGNEAFYNCPNLTNVTILEGVEIGSKAFLKCTNLEKIIILKNTKIGPHAFSDCQNLTDITLSKGTKVGNDAFYNCQNLTNVTILEGVEIGCMAFSKCKKLEKIIIPKNTKILPHAFSRCQNLTDITLPEGVEIGSEAFSECTKLKKIIIPKKAKIDSGAFEKCQNLTDVTLSESIDKIGSWAFTECTILEKITIPKKAKIDRCAFEKCQNLTDITLPEGVEIGSEAFSECTKLKKIIIPKNAKIGSDAFRNCQELAEVIISKGVEISENAFAECSNLSKITISKGTKIAQRAFSPCSGEVNISGDAGEKTKQIIREQTSKTN